MRLAQIVNELAIEPPRWRPEMWYGTEPRRLIANGCSTHIGQLKDWHTLDLRVGLEGDNQERWIGVIFAWPTDQSSWTDMATITVRPPDGTGWSDHDQAIAAMEALLCDRSEAAEMTVVVERRLEPELI